MKTAVITCPIHPAKRRYADRLTAQIAVAWLRHPSRRDTASGKVPCRAYRCPGCSGWHLTSKEKKE